MKMILTEDLPKYFNLTKGKIYDCEPTLKMIDPSTFEEVPPSFIVMNDNKNYIKIRTSYFKSIEENREDKINNILNK